MQLEVSSEMHSERFRVTPKMDEILRDGGLDHGMIEAMAEHTLDSDTDIDGVQLSMSGRDEDVLRTGAVVIEGQVCGFEVTRTTDDDVVHVTVKIEAIDWADETTVSL